MHLRQSVLVLVSFLLALAACAGLPFFGGSEDGSREQSAASHQDSSAEAVLEFQNPHYDGETLSGRLLVGVTKGELRIDRRLIVNASVEVESVWDCATGQPTGFLEVDSFPRPAREDELLTLTPGYWYGADVRFFLFDPKFTGTRAPDCIEVGILYRMESGDVAGRSRVQVDRASPPVSGAGSADAGPVQPSPGPPTANEKAP